MRGRSTLGATFFAVMSGYAGQLAAVGGRLYLTGLDAALIAQAERTGLVAEGGPVRLYAATPVIGDSSLHAVADAHAWLARGRPPDRP
jgi:SulP family sulfate permease